MAEMLPHLLRTAQHSISRLKVKSALNPCLWLSGLMMVFGFFGSIFAEYPINVWMAWFMFCAPSPCIIGFIWFMFADPDKLRSEAYELKKTALGMIEQKGGAISVDTTSIETISNIEYSSEEKTNGEAS